VVISEYDHDNIHQSFFLDTKSNIFTNTYFPFTWHWSYLMKGIQR